MQHFWVNVFLQQSSISFFGVQARRDAIDALWAVHKAALQQFENGCSYGRQVAVPRAQMMAELRQTIPGRLTLKIGGSAQLCLVFVGQSYEVKFRSHNSQWWVRLALCLNIIRL